MHGEAIFFQRINSYRQVVPKQSVFSLWCRAALVEQTPVMSCECNAASVVTALVEQSPEIQSQLSLAAEESAFELLVCVASLYLNNTCIDTCVKNCSTKNLRKVGSSGFRETRKWRQYHITPMVFRRKLLKLWYRNAAQTSVKE